MVAAGDFVSNRIRSSHAKISTNRAAAVALAAEISLPHDSAGVRLPTVDYTRTSVGKFNDQFSVTTSVGTPIGFNPGDQLFAFFGQPNRLVCYSYYVPSGASCTYNMIFSNQNYTFTVPPTNPGQLSPNWSVAIPGEAAGETLAEVQTAWPVAYGALANAVGMPYLHGVTMPVGDDHNSKYVFLAKGESLSVSLVVNGTFTGFTFFQLREWRPSSDTFFQEFEITNAGVYTVSAPHNGYYSLWLRGFQWTNTPNTTSSVTINVVWQTNTTTPYNTWATVHMGDLDTANGGDLNLGRLCRVNACSLLITNTTAVINRQGNVIAARVNDQPFQNVIAASLQKSAEMYTGDAANGVYTFKEFSREAERYVSVTTEPGGLYFDLAYNDYFHFIQIQCPNPSTTANTFNCKVSTVLEYVNDIQRYPKGVSAHSYEDLIEARRIINATPDWFYENPMHWSQILQYIKDGVKAFYNGAKTYGPTVLGAVGGINPGHAMLYNAAGNLLRALP